MKVTKLDAAGKSSQVNVIDDIFGVAANDQLLSQAIRVYQSNLRQGTSQAKTRGEIIRTKRKWYKQKGTGNARHGARSANIFVGGGVAHGPKGVENWSLKLTTRMKKQALALALSAQAENIRILESILSLKGKTKDGQKVIDTLGKDNQRILVIMPEMNSDVLRSLSNIESVLLVTANQVTALEVLTADLVVLTGKTIEVLETRLNSIIKKPAKSTSKPKAKPSVKTDTKAKPKKTAKKADK